MTTLSDIRGEIAGALRDSANTTWATGELDDLINQGIDEIADFYPKEIVQTLGTVSAGVFSYAASSFTKVYRIDIYSGTSYLGPFDHRFGDSRDDGWELHGGVLYLPINIPLATGYTVQAWGYGRYIQLSVSSSTTDLDASGLHALKTFVQMEALNQLVIDRAKFQQYQSNANATDATLLSIAQSANALSSRWRRQQQRLRRLRKV